MDRRQTEHVLARMQPLLRPEVSQEQVRHALGNDVHASSVTPDLGLASPPLTTAALQSVWPPAQQNIPTVPVRRAVPQQSPNINANIEPNGDLDIDGLDLPFLPHLANQHSAGQQIHDSGIGTDMSSDKPPASNSGQVEASQPNFAPLIGYGTGSLLDQEQSEYFTAEGSDLFMGPSDGWTEDPYTSFLASGNNNV